MHIANIPKILMNKTGERLVRLALGNFDGVHLGHRDLISGLADRATAAQQSCVVMTFSPHPVQYFQRDQSFRKIDTRAIKERIFETLGVEGLLELDFNEQLAKMSGPQFLATILEELPLAEVAVGYDFKFGSSRSGGLDLLSEWTNNHGIILTVVPPVTYGGEVISSSRIRAAVVDQGNVQLAETLLARPFALAGGVVKGQQLGRTIGFPTANIVPALIDPSIDSPQIVPKVGVYAGRMMIFDSASTHSAFGRNLGRCVINVGYRPTVTSERKLTVEAHIYDQETAGNPIANESLDLYGSHVELQFMQRIRDELRFDGLDALKKQIGLDIMAAKKFNLH